jgi:hypothetical protein
MTTAFIGKTARALCVAAALSLATAANATIFVGHLDGPTEGTISPGVGDAIIDFDLIAHSFAINVSFSGLTSGTTASHVHAPTAVPGFGTAGVATMVPTFAGFPLGVTAGTYSMTFDTSLLSFYNPAFVTAQGGSAASAEAALFNYMTQGRSYLNIHTSAFPGGEIRGFLIAVPEAATWMMMLTGFGVSGLALRRRRSLAPLEPRSA